MKVIFHKNAHGQMAYKMAEDDYVPAAGEFAKDYDEFTIDEMPAAWAERRVWDDATGEPRLPTSTESLEAARANKLRELEGRFQQIADQQFGTSVYAGIIIYLEMPNDPRTVAVKAARTNFIQKSQALADLGRSGRPPLTQTNIEGISW